MIVKSKNILELFGISKMTLSNWRKRKCPQLSRGKWDLRKVLEWWFINVAPDKLAENDETLADAKRFFWSSRSKREELRLQVEREELISRKDVEKEAFECARMVRDSLQNIPSRIAAILAGESSEHKIEKILDKEIRQALESLSK